MLDGFRVHERFGYGGVRACVGEDYWEGVNIAGCGRDWRVELPDRASSDGKKHSGLTRSERVQFSCESVRSSIVDGNVVMLSLEFWCCSFLAGAPGTRRADTFLAAALDQASGT